MPLISKVFLFACVVMATASVAAEPTRVLIVVGPSTHPPGSHEVAAGGRLMGHCLENMSNVSDFAAEVVYRWPKDPSRLNSVSTIVFIGDTFPPQRMPETATILSQLDTLMARGCGIVCVHYATGLWGQDVGAGGEHPLLGWLGGYFANKTCPHHQGIAKIYPAATITPSAPGHPISRGWNEFTLHDEPYINNYFGGDENQLAANVTALATSMLPPESPRQETVAWCVERPDGGRGFAIVMPHFYKNWGLEDLRRFILNGIVWTAKREVPEDGVQTKLPELITFAPGSVEFPADPDRLVRRIIESAGGAENLLTRFTIQERLNVSDDPEKPGKPRESVFDGHEDWWFRGGKGKWKKKKNEPAADLVWAWTLQALVDKQSKLKVLAEMEEGGKTLVGLRISETISPGMDVYFDKADLRLVRIDWRNDINRFSDWREHDGVKYPSKCIGYRKKTGKPWFVSEIIDLERLRTLPDQLQPSAPIQ
jgi:type 1 glutamine amidotransferase